MIRLCVCACWSAPLLVAHTTLLEISLLFFREMLRSAITYLFCLGGKSTGVRPIHKLNSNTKHQEVVSHNIFKESVNLHFLCLCAFL